jgi:hypothetical protein
VSGGIGGSDAIVGAVEGMAAPPAPRRPFLAFPPRPIRRERWPRRLLAGVATLYQWAEVLLDRLVSPSLNPLYHSGTIAVFSLAVATVTGLYLFVFYRVGTEAAHQSIEGIMAHPLGIGALMRSLHRYASDAAILAAVLHGLKMLLDDRFWGARWIGWVSGLALVSLVWVTGATGYWLVWDAQAQILSVTTAKLLDVLPIFGEPLVRTFVDSDRIQMFLFSSCSSPTSRSPSSWGRPTGSTSCGCPGRGSCRRGWCGGSRARRSSSPASSARPSRARRPICLASPA